jgi:hypothetical protein
VYNGVMQGVSRLLYQRIADEPVIYVTRDSENALGIDQNTPGYQILTGGASRPLDTHELLGSKKLEDLVRSLGNVSLLVFKNNAHLERIAQSKDYKLLNPSAELADKIEGKIPQVFWLGPLAELLPPHKITTLDNLFWKNEPFVLQYNHSHSGKGTILIENEEMLGKLQNLFPERDVRVTRYVEGPVFTNNNIVTENDVLLGNISYQITGLPPLSNNAFSSVGNDWYIPEVILDEIHQEKFRIIARSVGERMRQAGWRGVFGIDVVWECTRAVDKMHLLEINARQPASVAYESTLQKESDPGGLSIFEAHLAALLGIKIDQDLIKIKDGSRLVKRNRHGDQVKVMKSRRGVMSGHQSFNEHGKKLLNEI